MPAVARPRASDERLYTSWDRARLSVVVPIGVIVAVAIICIVVAVLSSAQRADEVAVQNEKQLFTRALTNYGERVLREVKSVAASNSAMQNIRVKFDSDWATQRVGLWLRSNFDHNCVFIFDGNDELILSQLGHQAADPSWFEQARPDLASVLDHMHGRDPVLHDALRLAEANVTKAGPHAQAAVVRSLMGQPAVIAAVAVGPGNDSPAALDNAAPIIMSVKFIDRDVLADIAAQLRLTNLRKVDDASWPPTDLTYELVGPQGNAFARFA